MILKTKCKKKRKKKSHIPTIKVFKNPNIPRPFLKCKGNWFNECFKWYSYSRMSKYIT